MNEKMISVDYVVSLGPCEPDYTTEIILEIFGGRDEITLREVLELNIPSRDMIWFLTQADLLTGAEKRLYACWVARNLLPVYEVEYPDDSRVRSCIETAERFARGDATWEEVRRSRAAAWSAAFSDVDDWGTAWSPATRAAHCATWCAAMSATRCVIWCAALHDDDAIEWHLSEIVHRVRVKYGIEEKQP